MLLSTQQCLATASGHVCSKGFGLSILRERQRAFRPSFFYGATNDSFLKSRAEEGLICFVAAEGRPEPWLWVFEEEGRSSTRDSAILIRELDEALQKNLRLWREQVIQSFFFLFLFNGCWTKNEWMWRIIVCMNESAYQYHSFIFTFQLFYWRTIHFTFLKNVQTSLHSICI